MLFAAVISISNCYKSFARPAAQITGAIIMVNRKLFRPVLTEVKEQYVPRPSQPAPQAAPAARKKPAPPEQTFAENFYFVKQMQARTPVAVVLTDGEVLRGTV